MSTATKTRAHPHVRQARAAIGSGETPQKFEQDFRAIFAKAVTTAKAQNKKMGLEMSDSDLAYNVALVTVDIANKVRNEQTPPDGDQMPSADDLGLDDISDLR